MKVIARPGQESEGQKMSTAELSDNPFGFAPVTAKDLRALGYSYALLRGEAEEWYIRTRHAVGDARLALEVASVISVVGAPETYRISESGESGLEFLDLFFQSPTGLLGVFQFPITCPRLQHQRALIHSFR